MIKEDFVALKEVDMYSLSMFVLYKLINIDEYSVIGELPYVLDKDNLFNLCKCFGGLTIKIPTIDELYNIMHIIMLYQYVNIDNMSYDDAVSKIGFKSSELRNVKLMYCKVCDVLNKYNFNRDV